MKKYSSIIVFAIVVLVSTVFSITGIINESIGTCISLGLISLLNLLVAIISLKHNIKAISITMFILTVLGASLLTYNIYSMTKKTEYNSDFRISITPGESPKTKIFTHNNKNYYTYNLKSVDITIIEENQKYTLEEAMTKNKIELGDILNLGIANDNTSEYKVYYDGGNTNIGNDSYSVIMCENNDVIFSNFNFKSTDNICEN